MFPPVSTSDHQLILCRWKCTEHCRELATRRPNFNKADCGEMSTVLASVNWPQIFSECSTVNDYWLALYRVLKTVIRDFVPVTTCLSHRHSTRRQRVPHEVHAPIIHKRKAWRRWKATSSAETKALYNKASRTCSSSIRRHTTNDEEILLHMNQHSFYTCVSRQLHPASYGISLINDGNSPDSPLDIAQCFSAEFSKNFSISACDEIVGISTIYNVPKLDLINVDIGTVCKLLMQQRSSAAGPEGIPGLFYRKLAGVLTQPLAIVFQQSLYQRAIPDMWRNALVIPLFKGKGSKASASSYRPVSLSDIAYKVLERVIVNQIRNFWLANNMLCREQHAFLPRRSTVSNLIMCDSLISNLLNEGNVCDVILLDFVRAFDKVPHNIVLQKLTRLGIAEQPLEWISNFLSARSQVVSYNGALSEATPVSSGVIQGPAIGPLLFVAFINDLPSLVSNCDLILFADDSKAVGKCNNRDEHALIQKDLNAISNWSAKNHLPFSIEKCACLN